MMSAVCPQTIVRQNTKTEFVWNSEPFRAFQLSQKYKYLPEEQ